MHPIFSETGDYPAVMREYVDARSPEGPGTRLPKFNETEIEYIKGTRLWASKEIIKSIKQLYNGRPKVMDFVEHFDKFLDQVEQSESGKGLKSLHIESCG